MKAKIAAVAILALLAPGCQSPDRPETVPPSTGELAARPDSPRLENGFYLILREGEDEAALTPMGDTETLIVYDYKFLTDQPDRPRQLLVVRGTPDVPLVLNEDPQGLKGEDGRTILYLTLARDQTDTLERFTREHAGGGVAIIIGGEVVSTHKIRETIRDGKSNISRCTDNACEYILTRLRENLC